MKKFRGCCEYSQRTLPLGHGSLEKATFQVFLKKFISFMVLRLCWAEHFLCLLLKTKYIDIQERFTVINCSFNDQISNMFMATIYKDNMNLCASVS